MGAFRGAFSFGHPGFILPIFRPLNESIAPRLNFNKDEHLNNRNIFAINCENWHSNGCRNL